MKKQKDLDDNLGGKSDIDIKSDGDRAIVDQSLPKMDRHDSCLRSESCATDPGPKTDCPEIKSNGMRNVLDVYDADKSIQTYSNDATRLSKVRALSEHHLPYYQPEENTHLKTVLVEEDYHRLMRHLIERDYFPDIERMKLQVQIYEAMDARDDELVSLLSTQLVKQIQKSLRREENRRLNVTNYVNKNNSEAWRALQEVKRTQLALREAYNPTLGGNDTPLVRGEEEDLDPFTDVNDERVTHVVSSDKDVYLNMDSLTLESFHRRFTSEDNASFVQLTQETKRKRAQKYLWMTKDVDAHNMRNLKMRLEIEDNMALVDAPTKRVSDSNSQKLRELVFSDLINTVDAEKIHQHKVSTGAVPPDPLSILPVNSYTLEKQVIDTEGLHLKIGTSALIYNTAEPKSSVFFPPETRPVKITEPKLISTASTRLNISSQLDDALELDEANREIMMKSHKKKLLEMQESAAAHMEDWLRGSNLDAESKNLKGLELLQMGVDTMQYMEGFEFIEEDKRELLGYNIASKVLEKKRRERYNESNVGRLARGKRLKEALNTPMTAIDYGTGGLTTTCMGTATGTGTMGTGTMGTGGVYGGDQEGISRNLTPLLRTNQVMRRHLHSRTKGILSSKRSHRDRGGTSGTFKD